MSKEDILNKFPFYREFISGKMNRKVFLENLAAFKEQLMKEGLSEEDIFSLTIYETDEIKEIYAKDGWNPNKLYDLLLNKKTNILSSDDLHKLESAPQEYSSKESVTIERIMSIAIERNLKDKIDSMEYDVLVGDDTSARIPTLILRKVINKRYKILNSDKEETVKTYFIPRATGINRDVVDDPKYIERIKIISAQIKKKALFVTDMTTSGSTIYDFIKSITDEGKRVDVIGDIFTTKTKRGYEEYRERLLKHTNSNKIALLIEPLMGYFDTFRYSRGVYSYRPGAITIEMDSEARELRNELDLIADRILLFVWGQK